MSIRLASALSLFEDGYAIFPIAEDSKIPLVKWTSEWATERDQVVDYWTTCPGDNIGINCQESALLVVDLDGANGIANFQRLWAEHGTGKYEDYTRWSITPSDGRHVWFEHNHKVRALRNTTSGLAPSIDTRGAGGMIVAPGSQIEGRVYRLINRMLPTRLPDWLEQRLRVLDPPLAHRYGPPVVWGEFQSRLMLAEVPRRVAVAAQGRRNAVLNREAWRMRAAVPVLGLEAVQAKLLAAAEQNGLPEYEARRTIRSGLGC
jgi:hypothetical protein